MSQTTTYSYNSRDLLSAQVNGLNERTTYAYDGEGRESLRQTANGVRVSTSYDNNGGVSLKQYWNSANTALAIYSGSYTRREQLSNQAELGTYPASYTYYPNYQLGHDYRGSEQVNNYYDGAGNLSSRDNAGTTNYTYNSLNQMLTAVTGSVRTTLAYDLEGNMTSEIVGSSYTTFSYDAMNRLTTVNKDGTSESYVYSADGLRQQKTAGGSTIDYMWDGQNVLVETNTSLVVQASYVDYPGMWGGLVSQSRSGTSNWYGFDLAGNTRILVSVGGVVTDSYSYRAFGEETAARGTTVNPYRFGGMVGYYRDSATREYLRQRHYRSDLSRFMSQDPIGFGGGDVNLYRYVRNRPTNFGDPSGLDWFDNTSNYFAGWGDTVSFGRTAWLRGKLGYDDAVDYGSGAYMGGVGTGVVHSLVMGYGAIGAAGPVAAGVRGYSAVGAAYGVYNATQAGGRLLSGNSQNPYADGAQVLLAVLPFAAGRLPRYYVVKNPNALSCSVPGNFRLGKRLFIPYNKPVLFGQSSVSKSFNPGGDFGGKQIRDIANALKRGMRKPDELPIQVFDHNGNLVTANNRSLTALSYAGKRPTNITLIRPENYIYDDLVARLSKNPLLPRDFILIEGPVRIRVDIPK